MVRYEDLYRICMEEKFDEEVVKFRTELEKAVAEYRVGDCCGELVGSLPNDIREFAEHGLYTRDYPDETDETLLEGVQVVWLDEKCDDGEQYTVIGGVGIIHPDSVEADCKKLRMEIAEYFCNAGE